MTFETDFTASFVCNREVRRIPRGWQHPRDAKGRFLPLLPADYLSRLSDAERADILEANALIGYDTEAHLMPPVAGLAPDAVEIAAYETTSEGTPISPAFADTPEGRLAVANWCAFHSTTFGDKKADPETWAAVLFGDGAWVCDNGRVEFA
jgi:hypothetical protein